MANSFERLYDGLWARREAGHNGESSTSARTGNSAPAASPRREAGHDHSSSASAKAGSKAPSTSLAKGDGDKSAKLGKLMGGTVLRGTNRGERWSMAGEVTQLQRRVADLAAELQVQCACFSCSLQCLQWHICLNDLLSGCILQLIRPAWQLLDASCCRSSVTESISISVHSMVKLL